MPRVLYILPSLYGKTTQRERERGSSPSDPGLRVVALVTL